MSKSYVVIVAAVAFGPSAFPALAVEWNVNPGGTGDAPTIQAAYDLANAGDVIVLEPGIYQDSNTRSFGDWHTTESTTAIAFVKPGVDLTSTGGADATILDGEFSHHGLVGTDLGATRIQGVTFQDCRPAGTGGLSVKAGAGCILFRSQPTVDRCVFRRCIAPEFDVDGASGLYIIQGSGAVVSFNYFADNYGGDIGGAAGILEHTGGLLVNNTFVRNGAGDAGGAVEVNGSVLTVRNNVFAFNFANSGGGAFACLGSTVITSSCNLFWENDAPVGEHVYPGGCIVLGANNDLVADPFFCDAVHDVFTIQSNSPASPSDPSGCGLRGAFPVGCGTVSIESTSWGRIKASYFDE